MASYTVCSMLSGGKDSVYALHWAVLHGFRVCCILSMRPRSWDSLLFHYPASELARLQAEALGLELLEHTVGDDEYASLVEAFQRCRSRGARGVVSGALLSDYQRLRFAMAAEEAGGLKVYTPLWRKDQENYMRSLVREGFTFILVSVQAYGLPPELLGKPIGPGEVEEIIRLARRYGFNPAFEGGEAETLVLDAPLFRYKLEVEGRPRRIAPYHYVYEIVSARLAPKQPHGGGEEEDEASSGRHRPESLASQHREQQG